MLGCALLSSFQVVLHVHCAKEAAVVSHLEAILDPKTGQPKKLRPRALPSNSSALVEQSRVAAVFNVPAGVVEPP
jgi:elongation factor 1 alpha-like protein